MEKEKWGVLYPNGSATGAMGTIINRKADFAIGKFAMTLLRNQHMKPSISYFSSPLIIVVPPGEPFTSLEKLMKPFRDLIWTFVMAILIIAFAVITLLKWKFDESVQKFVFGARNASPYLNTLNVFLGGSLAQSQSPKRNFARTILCFFMLYCLVVRNSYTGALFTFIRSDVIRKPTLNSIDEMVEKDFTFFMIPTAAELTTEIPKVFERRSVMSAQEVSTIRLKMNDPSTKGGMLSSLEQIVYFNMMNYKKFMLNVCEEKLYTFQYCIYFQKHSHLGHRFDNELLLYQTNGLINNLVSQYVQNDFMKPTSPHRLPKALQLQQLMGSFWILVFGLSLATFVALLECLSRNVVCLQIIFDVV